MARVTSRLTSGATVDRERAPHPYAGGGLNYAFGPHLRAELGVDFTGSTVDDRKLAVRAVMLGLRADF